jgi:hypothetical protein
MTGKIFTAGLFIILICSSGIAARGPYQFVLKTNDTQVCSTPLSIDLEGFNTNTDTKQIVLYRIEKEQKISIPCQIESGHSTRLWFIPDRPIQPQEKVIFEIAFEDKKKPGVPITATTDSEAITLGHKGKDILRYQHAIHDVPQGVKPIYRRSAFIHPLWSPSGEILTRIQPSDHYHHYGIWNPWTKTLVEGKAVDFWNLGAGKGTVRFAGIVSTVSGPVYACFKVRQEHVVLKPQEKVAMNELWDVRAFAAEIENRPVWIIDFTSTLHNALETTIELSKYRYGGGIGFRATEKWNKDTSSVLTSEGKTRKDADASRARWCDINGASGNTDEFTGIVFFSHTANRQHPEPMRVWPETVLNGKGEMFFEFCPIRHESWNLEPEKEYVLRYRMIVYDGKMNPETAEALWKNYVNPPVITQKM